MQDVIFYKIDEVVEKSNEKSKELEKICSELDIKYENKTLEHSEEIDEIKAILKKELEGDNGIGEGLDVLKVQL